MAEKVSKKEALEKYGLEIQDDIEEQEKPQFESYTSMEDYSEKVDEENKENGF